MATKTLPRGMGTFFKTCDHPPARWSKCLHEYTIRFRNAAGRQQEESGFPRQDDAIERLLEIRRSKLVVPKNQARAERIAKYGSMRFEDYTDEWKQGQRDLAASSRRHLESLLKHHLYPALGSRRMDTFDHKVVEGFIRTMERNNVGLATQANAFDKLRAVLLDAFRLGLYEENPVEGVKQPQYDPKRAVIPTVALLSELRVAGDDAFTLVTDLMSGCGMRNGEAAAVNVNNIVADDVYRITEQVNMTTKTYGRLKHRRVGEYRDVPLPTRVRDTINWYADKHGTIDGYLLRQPTNPGAAYPHHAIANQWRTIKDSEKFAIPDGMVIYGFRHFFASNCLAQGIPLTDVADWMGHRNIAVTFQIYRHLLPGSISKAAKLINMGLAA